MGKGKTENDNEIIKRSFNVTNSIDLPKVIILFKFRSNSTMVLHTRVNGGKV